MEAQSEWIDLMDEFEDLEEHFRNRWALDQESPPAEFMEFSEEDWYLAKHLDQSVVPSIMKRVTDVSNIDCGLLVGALGPLAGRVIRLVRAENPFSDIFERFGAEAPEPYVARQISAIDFVRQLIEFKLAKTEGRRVATMAQRTMELQALVAPAKSERARAYLDRATKCFMLDMEPECVRNCRSALEAGLELHLDIDDLVYKRDEKKKKDRITMGEMLLYMRDQTNVPHEAYRAADRIREAGNEVVHLAPIGRMREIIADLKTVFEAFAELPADA